MIKMTKKAWFLAGLMALGAASGVYELATANRRAHQAQVERVTRDANARIARDQAALERRWAAEATQKKARVSSAPNAVDVANALCARLRQDVASTCVPHFNVWSGSYIDATIDLAPQLARNYCAIMAATVLVPDRPLAGMELKLFSPLGNGRPMAVCDL